MSKMIMKKRKQNNNYYCSLQILNCKIKKNMIKSLLFKKNNQTKYKRSQLNIKQFWKLKEIRQKGDKLKKVFGN